MPDPTNNPVQDAGNWVDNLGATLGAFATAVVEADSNSKDAYAARVIALAKAGSVDVSAKTSIIGSKDPMSLDISAPLLALTDLKAVEVESAMMTYDLTVSSQVSDNSETKGEVSATGSASVGIGPFQAKVSVSAHASYSESKSRSSDFRARIHAEMTFKQSAPPEGVAIIMDCVQRFIDASTKINLAIEQAKLAAIYGDGNSGGGNGGGGGNGN